MSELASTPVGRLFEAHLAVTDLERSIAFYRDRLGLELAHVVPTRQAAFFWIPSRGASMLGLWAGAAAPPTTAHIAFSASLDAVLAAPRTLRTGGITPLDFDGHEAAEPVVLAWMPAAAIYFRDPDGHLLEYIAMLADAPQPEAGVMTWQHWRSSASNLAMDHDAQRVDPGSGDPTVIRVLAISGSLRRESSNSTLVRAAVHAAPSSVRLSVYGELTAIPPFNPDEDTEAAPPAVSRLRAALDASDAVLISSPEYAHGVSGVLKNALDWLVGSGEFVDKPIGVVNTSARATLAHLSLCEILATMSGRVIADASSTIPLTAASVDHGDRLIDPRLSASLTSVIEALAAAAQARRAP